MPSRQQSVGWVEGNETQHQSEVGWVEGNETQQSLTSIN